ncbi:MAG TPA: ROK family protein [Acidobacteriaceae bacterium]|nr:ROK family protein [Acidobacteriaceae bacterium]
MHSNSNQHEVLVGVDIGGTKTAVVLSKSPPEVIWRSQFPTRPDLGPDQAVEKIVGLICQGLTQTAAAPASIGVSCGSPLDRVAGVIQRPPNLDSWDNVPIKDILEKKFGVRCMVENDANAGAVAEHQFGAGRGCQHLVFVTMGTGFGAGLILNGHIFRGACAMAGEIGHVRLTPDGPNGYGKAGSLEGWASGAGMARHGREMVRAAIAAGSPTALAENVDCLTARDIGAALAAGDPLAIRIVQETGRRLGDALALLVDLLNPERILIGGLALRLGEHLLGPARERMLEEALPAAANACRIGPAELGESIGDVAALGVAMGLHEI